MIAVQNMLHVECCGLQKLGASYSVENTCLLSVYASELVQNEEFTLFTKLQVLK